MTQPSKHQIIRLMFSDQLTMGLAHLGVWQLSRQEPGQMRHVTPGEAAATIARKHPPIRSATKQAIETLMLAGSQGRPLDTAVQYLGCLWEFQGTAALLELLVTIPEELAVAIAEEDDLPNRDKHSGRLRLRQGAIDAWHLAQYGTMEHIRVN